MKYSYYICDVFTDERFGGNQLAVLPDASGLNDRQMQQIAREFNFSESTFVFPAGEGPVKPGGATHHVGTTLRNPATGAGFGCCHTPVAFD